MFDLNKFKDAIDKIAKLPGVDIANNKDLKFARATNNTSLVLATCIQLVIQILTDLFINLAILKPGNKISEVITSVSSNLNNDDSINSILNAIYSEAIREPESSDTCSLATDFIYERQVTEVCKRIKILSEIDNFWDDFITKIADLKPFAIAMLSESTNSNLTNANGSTVNNTYGQPQPYSPMYSQPPVAPTQYDQPQVVLTKCDPESDTTGDTPATVDDQPQVVPTQPQQQPVGIITTTRTTKKRKKHGGRR